jgi:hypothetical protein
LSPSTDFLQYLFNRLELMMGVPIYGTYVSANKAFSIQITDANASNGNITGTYSANYSPAGPLSYQGSIGVYGWVFNKGLGRDGVAPFVIRFVTGFRPEPGRPYCINDTWTGAYQADNTMLLEGARVYVNSDGVVSVGSLGTLKFSM